MASSIDHLPNFVIPGIQKSGTTSLYHILKDHNEVYLPSNKEPHFFSNESNFSSFDQYEKLFSGVTEKHKVIGDASTSYFYHPEAPLRLKKYLGDHIKLIFIFREPVSRAISAYWQLYKRKIPGTRHWFEHRSLEEVFDYGDSSLKEVVIRERENIDSARNKNEIFLYDFPKVYDNPLWAFQYINNSVYSQFLSNYLKEFSREQMLFLTMEELKIEPEKVYMRLAKFLEIDHEHVPGNITSKFNETVVPLKGGVYGFAHFMVPYINKATANKFLFIDRTYRRLCFEQKPEFPKGLKEKLRLLFIEEREKMSKLTGLNLSEYW